MDARKLLENIEARGGVTTVKHTGGAAILNVSPRSLALELLPDIQKFKFDLIALINTPVAHRWESAATDATGSDPPATATAPDDLPDLRALSVAVAGAQRGAFISPTPDLMSRWRALDQYIGVKLTSRHVGAAARLVAQYPETSNGDLLEKFAAGLQPDDGGGKPVWIDPAQLAEETRAAAKARAKQHKETQTL